MDFTETINANIFPIISIIIGLSGLAFALYSYRKNRREKEPTYKIKTNTILSKPSLRDLKIVYNGHEVDNLAETKILFRNEGKIEIDKIDVAQPLTITPTNDNMVIYNFELEQVTRKSNEVSLTNIDKDIQINFKYLNHNDKFIVQILHSVESGQEENDLFAVTGEIKGVNNIVKRLHVKKYKALDLSLRLMSFFTAMTLSVFFIKEGVSDNELLIINSPLFSTFLNLYAVLLAGYWMFVYSRLPQEGTIDDF